MSAYDQLKANVDAFFTAVHERRRDDMECGRGCSQCCMVQLTLCSTEARAVEDAISSLSLEARQRLKARAADVTEACVMLEADGACAVYAARPLVCRSQGLPLSYDVAAEQLTDVTPKDQKETSWCPLNFRALSFETHDVLDAERLNTLLGLAHRSEASARGEDPLVRVSLVALAEKAC